ncbi:hypothetical protein SAMN05444375_10578 [Segatella baroniae B14]|nr:hypothetical protein SAMN04487899_10262 [Segatella bryantii]SEA20973.1 hypothetical protein SAMN05216455_104217 [Segatella bryantii]SEQ07521.1 hypothetical protein SAMN05444375_10578 [Segatella baroniae B14]
MQLFLHGRAVIINKMLAIFKYYFINLHKIYTSLYFF